MKKTLLPLLALFACQLAIGQTLNFVNKANMPIARGAFSGAKEGGYEYIANGFSGGIPYLSQIDKYDFANDSWSTLATSIPTIAKRYGNGEIVAGSLYLYNGTTETGLNNKFEIVELSTGNVTVSSNLNPTPVHSAGSAVWGDYLLSFGGCISQWNGTYSNKFYKIAPWGEWFPLADMPYNVETKGAVVYGDGTNSKLYVVGGYREDVNLRENFETAGTTGNLMVAGWLNISESGTKLFQGKTFASNKYAQISSFSNVVAEQEASNVVWLISPNLNVAPTYNFLSFDTLDGYDNGATLEAYLITNWTSDIATSTKTLLNAVISSGHTTDYAPHFTNSGKIQLTGASAGHFRIAFKYTGGYADSKTTTFQIDNVRIHEEVRMNNILTYDFNTNAWNTVGQPGSFLPHGISAHSVAVDDTGSKIYVTCDYDEQTFLGMYDVANGGFTTINQTNMIGRRHHKAEVVDNQLYLFGGNTTPDTFSSLDSTQSADLSSLATATFVNQKAFLFYPNPATDKITLNSNIESILLYTFDGKKINVVIQNNELDLSNLSKGVYLLQGTNKDGSYFSDKLIKN